MKQGELVMVKEANSALHNDCIHVKLTHERGRGPWTITAVITPGLCYRVTLQGRRERVRHAAASHIKPYQLRPPSLRHEFGDEYAHFVWGPDLGLVVASTVVSPLYTLVDRWMIQLPNGPREWRYRGRYLKVPSQDLSQKVNAWTASHPHSWMSFTPCGSCINHPATGPDPLQSQQVVNALQLTGHTLC